MIAAATCEVSAYSKTMLVMTENAERIEAPQNFNVERWKSLMFGTLFFYSNTKCENTTALNSCNSRLFANASAYSLGVSCSIE